jgi:hypothetical protein
LIDLDSENLSSPVKESHYVMAERFRENKCKKLIQRWFGTAKILAKIEIEDGVREYLPIKIAQTFDIARSNFLSEIIKLHKTTISPKVVNNLSLVYNKPRSVPIQRIMHTKT